MILSTSDALEIASLFGSVFLVAVSSWVAPMLAEHLYAKGVPAIAAVAANAIIATLTLVVAFKGPAAVSRFIEARRPPGELSALGGENLLPFLLWGLLLIVLAVGSNVIAAVRIVRRQKRRVLEHTDAA